MDLSGIISISGRPGLYKVIAQGKNSIIVESLIDNKRFPAYATDRISAIEDISIYTYEEDKPLKDILTDIYAKTGGKECPSHKEDISVLQEFLSDILPNYDEERVYPSDIKKIFQWFNLLLKQGRLTPEVKDEEKKPEKKEAVKKPAAKKVSKDVTEKKNATKAVKDKKDDKPKPVKKSPAKKKEVEK